MPPVTSHPECMSCLKLNPIIIRSSSNKAGWTALLFPVASPDGIKELIAKLPVPRPKSLMSSTSQSLEPCFVTPGGKRGSSATRPPSPWNIQFSNRLWILDEYDWFLMADCSFPSPVRSTPVSLPVLPVDGAAVPAEQPLCPRHSLSYCMKSKETG